MPGDKRSFEERLPHVLAVEKLLCDGKREADIIRMMGAKFGLTAKQVRQDIAAARRRWAKKAGRGKVDAVGAAFGMAVARRNRIYYLAMKAGDYRTALAALEDHDKLLGHYPRRTVVVLKPKSATAAEMTDAELARVVEKGLKAGVKRSAPASREPEPEKKGLGRGCRHAWRRGRAGRTATRRGAGARRRAVVVPVTPRADATAAPLPASPIAG